MINLTIQQNIINSDSNSNLRSNSKTDSKSPIDSNLYQDILS